MPHRGTYLDIPAAGDGDGELTNITANEAQNGGIFAYLANNA